MVNKFHDGVIKWKHFPHHWPFVRGIHRSPVNSPHKGQWRGALMFSLIAVWTIGWVNNRDAGDLRRHPAHYDVTVMFMSRYCHQSTSPVHLWMSVVLIRLGYEAHCSSKRLPSIQPLRPHWWQGNGDILVLVISSSFICWKSGTSDLFVLTCSYSIVSKYRRSRIMHTFRTLFISLWHL